MHNPTSVLENDTYTLLWDFDIQMGHLISARRLDLIIINKTKKTCKVVDVVVLVGHRENPNTVKKKRTNTTNLLGN